ncbi:hypothetical protein [Burkholderia ambifaria]|uniref:hypothetical protein n=1 Tax=Burkholderia ambifaria TaxID=152480 RepID=UPI00158EF903|nr:hypothetical protein [Burkholderia ambifaria]MBR8344180.1 hypothetical protein [Burkholderia ambifaria]
MTTQNEKSPAPKQASEATDQRPSMEIPAAEGIVSARADGGNGTSSKVSRTACGDEYAKGYYAGLESGRALLEDLRQKLYTATPTPLDNKLGDYWTSRGRRFSFLGWPEGGRPTDLFDREDWVGCLHACMFAASRRANPADLEDDGPLHELVHLACGLSLCTHNSMDLLREQIAELESHAESDAHAGFAASPVEQHEPVTAQSALAAIDTFEIVGENNDAREPDADDRFILTEFIAHLFGGFPVEQHEAAPADDVPECNGSHDPGQIAAGDNECTACAGALDEVAPTGDARECLMDVVSHRDAFVHACACAKLESTSKSRSGYWQHQIDVLNRMKAQAERALAAQPAPAVADERAAFEECIRAHSDPGRIDDRLARQDGHYVEYATALAWEAWQARASSPDAAGAEGAIELPHWFDAFLTNVCEIPDRNSPEGEPDAVVASRDELRNCAINAIEQCGSPARSAEPVAWVRKHPATGEISGDWLWNDVIEQCRKDSGVWFPLGFLTAPPAPASDPVGLTDVDILARASSYDLDNAPRIVAFARSLLGSHPATPDQGAKGTDADRIDAERWRATMKNGEPAVYVERTERRAIQHAQSVGFSEPDLAGRAAITTSSEMWVKRYVMFGWWARENEHRTFIEAVDAISAGEIQ